MLHHHSKVEVFVHYVWTTQKRRPFLVDPKVERSIWRCIEQQSQKLRCPVLAIGGTEDHVHLLIQLHSTVTLARLAQMVKGIPSNFANDELGFEGSFDWHDNYAAFSVSKRGLPRVRDYILNQKEHHHTGTTIEEWETTFKIVEYEEEPEPRAEHGRPTARES